MKESPRVDPRISATLRSDYEALLNDLQQAHEMAADFQRQLAGKSNEFALLKQVFEKTREDLGRLQAGIAALREERHRLADAAMKAEGSELKIASITAERDRAVIDLELMRTVLADLSQCIQCRDKQIAELTVENAILKQAAQPKLMETRKGSPTREPKTAAAERIHSAPDEES